MRHRSVWQVLGIYVVGSWVALQVADMIADNFGLPEWFFAFALALLVIGLPIVLATALVQQSGSRDVDGSEPGPTPASAASEGSSGFFTWRNAITGGIAAFALLGVVTVGWWISGGGAPSRPGVAAAVASDGTQLRSVAVLPFVTRSSVDEDAFFADGMHDDLLTLLSKVEALTVISRTSVERYRGTSMAIPEIASELGVAVIVEGGIQRAGDRVRVNMQLIEAATDRHLWAETYDQELTAENLFHIQSDLAQKIAGALQATLSPEVVERITTLPTESLEAFDFYTRGRYVYSSGIPYDVPALMEAKRLFEAAIQEDSTYAMAWAGLADVYAYGIPWGFSAEEGEPLAWAALDRALSLDPDLPVALSRRGLLHLDAGREQEGYQDFQRALELSPGSSVVVSRYGGFLSRTGRVDEAIENARRAVRLDPLVMGLRIDFENLLWQAGLFEEGIEASQSTLRLDPQLETAWYNLGWCYGMLGRFQEAIDAFETAVGLEERGSNLSGLAWANALADRREDALAAIGRALEIDELSFGDVAITYFELGDLDEAFTNLERAFRTGTTSFAGFEADWSAANMRAHPRYAELVTRMGLSPQG